MSWLSISLPNPFQFHQTDEEKLTEKVSSEDVNEESFSHGGGVKEDLSELGKTIGRQLWGVASFLAPPPVTRSEDDAVDSSQTLLGIRNDFAQIGGSFKTGLSLLSTKKAVDEISRLASNLLQFDEDEDEDELSEEAPIGGVVGVSEEAMEFATEMSMRPECWIDFPLTLDQEFDMSDAQREHASIVERLAPSLATLRIRLCPKYVNEGHFWMIYFILLHPRLNESDAELLSTPQIIESRNLLFQKLQNKENTQGPSSEVDELFLEKDRKNSKIEAKSTLQKQFLAETISETQESNDKWLEEDNFTGASQKQLGNEEDISFSDLEDEDDDASSRQNGSSPVQNAGISSTNGSNEWVRLNENSDPQSRKKKGITSREKDSEGEESNGWLTIDDIDSDGIGSV